MTHSLLDNGIECGHDLVCVSVSHQLISLAVDRIPDRYTSMTICLSRSVSHYSLNERYYCVCSLYILSQWELEFIEIEQQQQRRATGYY